MRNKIFWKLNIFDILLGAIIIGVFILAGIALFSEKEIKGQPTLLTIEVIDGAANIYPEAKKQIGREVYLNSVKTPVTEEAVELASDKLYITLRGKGEISPERYIFNGQRFQINQKAEIHSTYFAQGKIIEINYVD